MLGPGDSKQLRVLYETDQLHSEKVEFMWLEQHSQQPLVSGLAWDFQPAQL